MILAFDIYFKTLIKINKHKKMPVWGMGSNKDTDLHLDRKYRTNSVRGKIWFFFFFDKKKNSLFQFGHYQYCNLSNTFFFSFFWFG